jgi:Arc/MetJ family transcription regulator
VRRTQLYLDEDLWTTLRLRSRQEGTTVSELVRKAVRERYLGKSDERKRAMQAFVGIRKDRSDMNDPESYIRELRRGSRLERLSRT